MTTDANRVEVYRVEPDLADIKVGYGVRGQTAEATARLVHWVRGRGRMLIPWHRPAYTETGTTTLRYFVSPSAAAIARVWLVDVRASTKTATTVYTIQAGAGATSAPKRIDGRSINSLPQVYIEPDATQSVTAAEISIVIAVSAGTARIESVCCYELPRAALERDFDTSLLDLGLALDSYYPREDVFEANDAGLKGLAETTAILDTRRIGHVAMWRDDGFATTSATFVKLMATPPRIVPSKDRVADTTRVLEGYVWAVCSNGTTSGEFDIQRADGTASTAIAIPLLTTVGAWFGPAELAFNCEDLAEADGAPSGGYDTMNFRFRRTAGAGTVTIHGYTGSEKYVP
jgi:hypothetical protein